MPSSKENDDTFTSLAEGSTDSAAVKEYYDDWAKDYDQTLDDWEYRTPADAAALICPQLSTGNRILDVGCGTGLFAAEVRQRIEARLIVSERAPVENDGCNVQIAFNAFAVHVHQAQAIG